MVREVVEEVATIIISDRHLNIAAVIRRLYTLCWQIPDYICQAYIHWDNLLLGIEVFDTSIIYQETSILNLYLIFIYVEDIGR